MSTTSPVTKVSAALPKGHGLARIVPQIFEQRGSLVPFIGFLRVDETGLDADDVQHARFSIARLEPCIGDLEHDAKGLLARATTAANEYGGQGTLFPEPGSEKELLEQRELLLTFLREWQDEQKPPLDDDQAAERWNSWHGGFYDARPEKAAPVHLREFLLYCGALAEDQDLEPAAAPVFSDTPADDPAATDPAATDDEDLDGGAE